jgi:tetratricopeptide (TPR) repeat protein
VATANPEAYALYLKATTVFNQRNGPKFAEAIAALNEAIRLDPGFARAHSRLGALHGVATNYTVIDADEAARIAESEARRAIELDPTLAEAHAVLGLVSDNLRRSVEGRAALERAMELDPRDVTTNFWLGINLINAGYIAQGTARMDRTLEIDPLYPNGQMWRAYQYQASGDRARARALAQQAAESGLRAGDHVVGEVLHSEGRDEEAIEHFSRGFVGFMSSFPDPEGASKVLAEGLYGNAAAHDKALAMIDAYLATKPKVVSGAAPWALLSLGEPARALAVAQPAATGNDPLFFRTLWSPKGAAARKLPQFPEFARKVGFTEVWEKYGPPDSCKRRAPGDYACE